MKRMFFLLVSISLLATTHSVRFVSAQENPPPNEPESGAVVCEPDAYLATAEGCLPLGPSQYLGELLKLGITIPPRPLPAFKPDPSLNDLPYRYYDLNDDELSLLSQLINAAESTLMLNTF